MASVSHTIRYRYTCESCGKQTEWFDKEFSVNYMEWDSLTSAIKRNNAISELRALVDNVQFPTLEKGKACPFCGKPQSWIPQHNTSTTLDGRVYSMTPGARIFLYPLGYISLMLVISLVLGLIFDIMESGMFWSIWAFVTLALIVLGVIQAVRRNKRNENNAFINKAKMNSMETRNLPEIDFNGFYDAEPPGIWICRECGQPNRYAIKMNPLGAICIGCGKRE